MNEQVHLRFRTEVRHFSLVAILNFIFAAIVMAMSVAYIVDAVFGIISPGSPLLPRAFSGAVALACFGLAISWIISTIQVFEGVEEISGELEESDDPVSEDRITCLMVKMLAHYRNNQATIRRMILVSTLGGYCFFALGILTSLEAFVITSDGISFTLDSLLVIPAMILTIGIALVSLLSSHTFSQFAATWDRRIEEIDAAECTLKKNLGLDES
ncbi:MAG: hypothetical protein CVV32_06795 [Methanomicrobiales archaeon HGW-Methanomicrobiales-3]|jgi:uncharacterized membrane protein (DUF485 family)|nr:MAG: hypothetical protein CVV32_06795 [Methanomicrobiales archaeon HGW-Methanomicrobiales-3]